MTKFEDQLFAQLMAEHGDRLRAVQQRKPARRRLRRPAWLAAGAAACTVAGVTAAVLALGSAPAMAAYSVTRHDGTVTVSVYRASGVPGANAALHRMHARVVVVQVRPGCRPIRSLPRPHPVPHPDVWAGAEVNGHGHRAVSIKIKAGSIPADDTLLLAFSGGGGQGSTSLGAGGIITGPVPRCVSLPSAQSGQGRSGSTITNRAGA